VNARARQLYERLGFRGDAERDDRLAMVADTV
jgi:RimJ/RimL family protein N-acetyltransferase